MSGALYQGSCYATVADAASAAWSGVAPVVSAGSPPFVSTVGLVNGQWTVTTSQGGAVVGQVAVPSLGFAQCDVGASAVDGSTLGFAVVGVWVAAWCVMALKRGLR